MKTTISLYELVRGELITKGLDEFIINGELVAFNEEYQFIQKMMKYDLDVHTIVTKRFFQGFTYQNDTTDQLIKKLFMNRFINREIGQQTIESFSTQVLFTVLSNEFYISEVAENLQKYIENENSSISTTVGNNTSDNTSTTNSNNTDSNDNRNLESSLPQSNVNLNVDDTVLDYGDRNTISRTKSTGLNESETVGKTIGLQDTNTTTITKSYDLETLLKSNGLLEEFFIKLDQNCFLQTW